VNKGFTPARSGRVRAAVCATSPARSWTSRCPEGEFDFVEEVAKQLPIQVLCRILGVPLSDDERLIAWGDKMIGNTDPDLGGLHRPARRARSTASTVPQPVRDGALQLRPRDRRERRQHPTDDLVSKLVMWEDETATA
jgi:cytochrome P450